MTRSYDAVIVGSGINSLAAGALLAREGWSVCVLERNDYLGGAIRTAEITEPGYLHEVFSSWHPLWVGGAAHARLGDDARRARARVPEHRAADRDALPRRRGRLPAAERRRERRRARPPRRQATAWPGGATLEDFFPNADLAFGVLGTELWSPAGVSLASRAYRRLGRRGLLAFGGSLLHERARLADRDVRVRAGARR